MPRIELELSDKVYELWQGFMRTEPAGRLVEAGLLGDWVALGFMGEVNRYIAEGVPRPQAQSEADELSAQAAVARRKLAKPQKRVLPMFNENEQITLEEISRVLGMDPADGRRLVEGWLAEGFLATGPGREGREAFVLGQAWRRHNLAANRPSLNAPRQPLMLGKLPDELKLPKL
jgi:hypothetical protein